MSRTPTEAIDYVQTHRNQPQGMCLRFVRLALDVPALYPSAIAAWDHATRRHHGDASPPKGVAVYWFGGRFGHVALSAGAGKVWSTDILTYGRVDLVHISTISESWGYSYLGWSADLNGVRVWSPPHWVRLADLKAAANHDRFRPVGKHPEQTNRIRKALGFRIMTGRWSRPVRKRWSRRYPGAHGVPTEVTLRDFCSTHDLTYLN